MARSLRRLSALLLASTVSAGYACASGNNTDGAGGAGGEGGSSGTPSSGPGAPSSGSGSSGSQSSGAGGMTGSSSSASGSVSSSGSISGPSSSSSGSSASSSSASSSSSGGGGGAVTFTVVRVGDGAAMLSSAATAVFLEDYSLDGTLVAKPNNPLPLPTAVNGNNQPLTLAGSAASEGALSRSGNGSYVTLGGYAAIVGTGTVGTSVSTTVNRVIGRIGANGNVDTTTRLAAAFSGASIRGAATSDGTGFWASGNGLGSTGGVHYIPFGAAVGTQVLGTPNNTRWIHVFAGQLYATSGSGAYVNVFTIGAGLPTTSGQVATTLSGLPASAASPYSFALFDRDPSVAGVDTLYIADDQAAALGGGVQKWQFNGVSWSKTATYTQGITTGVRGLAGVVTGSNVTLVATTAEPSENHVVVYVDDGGANPTGMIVATAGLNTAFRGIAISPK